MWLPAFSFNVLTTAVCSCFLPTFISLCNDNSWKQLLSPYIHLFV